MRILIDLQGAQNGSRQRGIGRYSLALSKAIARNAGKHQVFILLNGLFPETIEDVIQSFNDLLPLDHFLVFSACGPVDELRPENAWRRLTGEVLREHVIAQLLPDALLITSMIEGAQDNTLTSIGRISSPVATAAILYDLIPLSDPDRYIGWEPAKNWYHNKIDSLRRADHLFAISDAAAEEAMTLLGVAQDRVSSISSAADESFSSAHLSRSEITSVTTKFGINRKYLMHSSAFEPRKNFQGLIRAFAELPKHVRKDFQLVLVCKLNGVGRSELEEVTKTCGLTPSDVVLTGYVSDADLIALYSGCHLFVFPSFHEGFGLPALEAMCCGAPAIGSNLTSIPEVIGRRDALFDPASIQSMSALIQRVLTDASFYASLKKHAEVQSSKFSWDATATRVIAGLDGMVASRDLHMEQSGSSRLPEILEAIAEISSHITPTDADVFELAQQIGANENAVARVKASADFCRPLTWRVEGPFDSTYSLALLNRETARALSELGHIVVLHSTEGPGDFPANPAFLKQNPDLAQMHSRVPEHAHSSVDVVSRNLYPPRVDDMGSSLNLLHHYAWEESGFPQAWVEKFNAHLHGMTCLSTHVEKVLVDNGVSVPMATSGCGVDHWERVIPTAGYAARGRRFRFLHVSSCFPRKGAETLLDAFGKAFSDSDDVSLVIKTFPNPHNEIHSWLAERRKANSRFPDVVVIEDDLSDSDLKALYQSCHAFVAPTRAEGFGLPLAEAMLSGIPVIATGWSGHLDFCNEQTAWLVDYTFRRAETHFGVFASVWADPDVDALSGAMTTLRDAPTALLRSKARAGRELLLANFKWSDVAARLVTAAMDWKADPVQTQAPRIGWITTWNTKCGIAAYSEQLLKEFPEDVTILAPHQDGRLREDQPNCVRCWYSSKDENSFEELNRQIVGNDLDTIILQFNYGFYNFRQLASFVSNQIEDGRIVIIMMHSTGDPELLPRWNWSLDELIPVLARCQRVLVHTVNDLNRLKQLGLTRNVALFPLGVVDVKPRAAKRFEKRVPLIATYGYCLPHKGLVEVIKAVALLREDGTPVRLRLVNAEYPAPVSKKLVAELRELIEQLDLGELVEPQHDYLADEESLRVMQEADLLVYAYQDTNESASAAVRHGVAASRPVAVTPLAIFDDLGNAVHRLPGRTPRQIADGVAAILDQVSRGTDAAMSVSRDAEKWRLAHSYSGLSKRLLNICTGLSHTKPSSQRVFDGSSRDLRTAVGEIKGRAVESTGVAGYLVFGPYLTLPPGKYEIEIRGSFKIPPGANAHLDVTVNNGTNVLSRLDFVGFKAGTIASALFQLDKRCFDLEIRVVVDSLAKCRIERIELSRSRTSIGSSQKLASGIAVGLGRTAGSELRPSVLLRPHPIDR